MKRYFGWLTYCWILVTMPLAAATTRIYVLNNAGASISVVDPATNKVVQTIEGIEVPHGVDFSPDGTRAYIGDEADHTMNVLDTRTGNIIKKVPLSGKPNFSSVTKDGKRVVACIAENPPLAAVEIIDTISLLKTKTIPMKGHMHDCYVTPDGKYAVAGSDLGNFVSVIDLKTEQPVWEVPFDSGIRTMAFEAASDGSTRRMFVQLANLNGFAVVDFATHKEVSRVMLPEGTLAPGSYGDISHGSGIAPDGKTFWINSGPVNAVCVYSLPDLKLIGQVALPVFQMAGQPAISGDPHWITFTPDSKTIYVSSTNVKLVSAIDVNSMKLIARIPVGEGARRIGTLVTDSWTAAQSEEPTGEKNPASTKQLDFEFFKARIQPIFLKKRSGHSRCYSCHSGNTGPTYLERFAPGSTSWTEEQSRSNFKKVSLFVVPGKPEASKLLTHPLAPEAGGDIPNPTVHRGGRQFTSKDDPDWQTLADWVRGATAAAP